MIDFDQNFKQQSTIHNADRHIMSFDYKENDIVSITTTEVIIEIEIGYMCDQCQSKETATLYTYALMCRDFTVGLPTSAIMKRRITKYADLVCYFFKITIPTRDSAS